MTLQEKVENPTQYGCYDIDECLDVFYCKNKNTFCKNTYGGAECKNCSEGCAGCSKLGNGNCKACAEGFETVTAEESDQDSESGFYCKKPEQNEPEEPGEPEGVPGKEEL